ncbi:hypothetical protein BGX38DRAFT_30921 [Terfezia claveryi]|nr:hypothetical protein BGX38DRAFT_30921 [Terfezia claveryi]
MSKLQDIAPVITNAVRPWESRCQGFRDHLQPFPWDANSPPQSAAYPYQPFIQLLTGGRVPNFSIHRQILRPTEPKYISNSQLLIKSIYTRVSPRIQPVMVNAHRIHLPKMQRRYQYGQDHLLDWIDVAYIFLFL